MTWTCSESDVAVVSGANAAIIALLWGGMRCRGRSDQSEPFEDMSERSHGSTWRKPETCIQRDRICITYFH